jgi:hypothetical protein
MGGAAAGTFLFYKKKLLNRACVTLEIIGG